MTMRYQIILEGKGGELDRREVETEEDIRQAALLLIADCPYLAGWRHNPRRRYERTA
jgi:hypothetical protein